MRLEPRQFARKIALAAALFCAALLNVAMISGCRGFRLPAIDPSGERIFLPAPNATTFESCLPTPAFATPPTPPACPNPPVAAIPAENPLCGSPSQQVLPVSNSAPLPPGRNQLKLTPSRIVAPVGSEVVLVAGYCGKDGYFVMKQPVEWTLTQDSVGHFVQVGQANDCLGGVLHEQPKKLSSNYAIGRTSTTSHVITRGNKNPTDDVPIHRGQSWLSVTSPTEGNSHITVVAPKAEGWDQRRQTATIHWIDAQWVLPPPAIVRAGQPVTLSTNVSRATNGSPLQGWLVEYEIVGGPAAMFRNNQARGEVQTDAAGNAVIELVPQGLSPGSSQIAVNIVRPASASGELPRTPVGQGWTTATWSAAGLTVNVFGPESLAVDATGTFQIIVSNNGDLPAPDVVVTTNSPPNMDVVHSEPAAQAFTGQFMWQLGDLPPRQTRAVNVQVKARRPGDVRFCVKAESRGDASLATEGCNSGTRIFMPALSLELSGPETAEVGRDVEFNIRIRNNSDLPLNNVVITDHFDPGFVRMGVAGNGLELPPIPVLAPGEVRDQKLTLTVRAPGQHCHSVQALANGQPPQIVRGCVQAVVNAGAAGGPLRLQVSVPPRVRIGEPARFTVIAQNFGNVPLTNVQIICDFDENANAVSASDGHRVTGRNQLVWAIQQLPPNVAIDRVIDLRISRAGQLPVRFTATADPNIVTSEQAATEIVPETGRLPSSTTDNDTAERNLVSFSGPGTGQLQVDITDAHDPIRVGEPTTYLIVVTNGRSVSDKNVVISVQLPATIDTVKSPPRITGPVSVRRISPDGLKLELQPIAEMRAGDVLKPIRLEVVPTRPGPLVIKTLVTSQRSSAAIEETETTDVAP